MPRVSSQRIRASRSPDAGQPQQGFTLIELMVTIALLAILLALATPSFTSIINSNRLASHANEFVASLQTARMEAVRRNTRTVVCRSDNGTSCTAGAQWNGWITFVDSNRDQTPQAAEILRVNTVETPVQVQVSNAITASRVVFRPDGLARVTNGSGVPQQGLLTAHIGVCIPTTQPAENQRLIQIRTGSRISVDPSNASGACATPAAPTP